MAVAFDAKSTADTRTATSATSATHNNLTVGSGSNRALVVTLTFEGASVPTSISVTWDSGGTNQACTAITGASATGNANRSSFLYGLVNPTSGNKTLAVSWTNTNECYCSAISFTGVDQTGGATSFPGGTGTTSSSNGTTSSVTVTSASGDYVVAAHNSSNDLFTAVNNTEIYRDSAGVNCSAANYAAGSASVSMTGTINSSSPWSAVGTSVKAAATATKAAPVFHRAVRFR